MLVNWLPMQAPITELNTDYQIEYQLIDNQFSYQLLIQLLNTN